MRLSFWDRVLAALYVILSLCLCVLVALRSLGVDMVGNFYEHLTSATGYWYFIYYGFIAIIVLLGVFVLRLIFARKPRRADFVTVDAGENGKVIIAMDALQEMVRQASAHVDGISDKSIDVVGHQDSISVLVNLTAKGGAHLPTITRRLQQEIRQYVEKNCGVAVREVTVTVGSVLSPEGKILPPSRPARKGPFATHGKKEKPSEGESLRAAESEEPRNSAPLESSPEEEDADVPEQTGMAPVPSASPEEFSEEADLSDSTRAEPGLDTPVQADQPDSDADPEGTDGDETAETDEAEAEPQSNETDPADDPSDDDDEDYPRWLND